jgi:diguanylate cyclase (GGDEF)-like protein/PAS domain S-box-containing protein
MVVVLLQGRMEGSKLGSICYENIIRTLPVGYAYQKMIFEDGEAVDYFILDMNDKMEEILGLQMDDTVDKRMQEILPAPEEKHRDWVQTYNEVLTNGEMMILERYSHALQRWYKVQIIPHGKDLFSVIFMDITEEKATLSMLDTFFSGSLGLLARLDSSGAILEVNPEWEAVTGYTRNEMIGRKMTDFIRYEDREEACRVLHIAGRGEAVRGHVNCVLTKKGEKRLIEWHLFEQDENIYSTALDITERSIRDTEIQRREAMLKNLTEEIPGGLCQLKINREGRFTLPYYSDGFLEMFEIKRETLKDRPYLLFEKVHEDDRDKALQSLLRSKEEQSRWFTEVRIRKLAGDVRWIRASSKPVFMEDGSIIWHGYITDITEEKNKELALKESEEKMRGLFSQVPGMIYQFNVHPSGEHELVTTSNGIWDLIKLSPETVYEDISTMFERVHPDDLPNMLALIEESKQSEKMWNQDFRVIHPDRGVRWVRSNASPTKLEAGVMRFYGYTYDITELKEKEEAIDRRDKLISGISSQVPGVIYQLVSQGSGDYRFSTATGSLHRIFGAHLANRDISDLELEEFVHEEDLPDLYHSLDISREEKTPFDETFRLVKRSGAVKWLRASADPRKMEGGETMWSGYITDVTDSKLTEFALRESERRYRTLAEQMEVMAYHDPLTGLPNRRLLFDRMEQLVRQTNRTGTKLGVLFLDLDNFKSINDVYGHDTGDKLLVKVAEKLKSAVRKTDTVARMAGDEFLIVFTNIYTEENLKTAASSVMAQFHEEMQIGEHFLKVEASSGAALYPDHGVNIETLLKNADKAMYLKKKKNKNGFALYGENTANRHSI